MGSKAIQGPLWGKNPKDWATIQEPTGNSGYTYAFNFLGIKLGDKLLDIGCGSGLFSSLAHQKGADVTGIDASEFLIAEAKERDPAIIFLNGEMEELPFSDNAFDIVCGFNSFQYASSVKNALTEARRVLKDKGKLVAMIWGNKEDCEAVSFMKAIAGLLPPPPPGAPGPFALTENHLLETIVGEAGLKVTNNDDIDSIWDYADTETTLKGLLSTGVAAKAIDYCGYQKVHDAIFDSMHPFIQSNGHVLYKNKFRVVVAEK